VEITIIDWGQPFDILKYQPPDKEVLFSGEIKGKLGIRTVKTICDKILYKRLKGKNKTILIKNISNC
jgi:anti-sigma regulatory factor (Ser/Thr protein kinase)